MAEILLQDVSVEYPMYTANMQSLRYAILHEGIGGFIRRDGRRRPVVEALRGINLHVRQGERVGLIGRNGAGKTTLLKVLANLCYPTGGTARIQGKVSNLMNVSSFMEPDMSGYENIYFMGLMLGFSKAKIAKMLPDIDAFTELGEYLHMPVRTYSSGMRVRLSFAMITSVDPDILVLDEALSAGDSHFIKKATQRAEQLYHTANILVMASHSADMIKRMCNRAVLLDKGRILFDGPVDEALARYIG